MKRFTWSPAVAAASLAALGCGTGPVAGLASRAGPAPVASREANACNAEVSSADVSRWRRVEAMGFTFCVPPDWSASGDRAWSRGTARVTWGISRNVAASDIPSLVEAASRAMPACVSAPARGSDVHPTPEMIGGRQAHVWRASYPRGFYTGGHWYDPHFYIVGEAGDAATADLEMAIVHTVRWGGADARPAALTSAAPAGSR
ncbi:MAG TPA: hypothetical protein VFJ16_25975 [Longimicrobium sp.]|nr:hypothetical protein [Longimicrobium sp.]